MDTIINVLNMTCVWGTNEEQQHRLATKQIRKPQEKTVTKATFERIFVHLDWRLHVSSLFMDRTTFHLTLHCF